MIDQDAPIRNDTINAIWSIHIDMVVNSHNAFDRNRTYIYPLGEGRSIRWTTKACYIPLLTARTEKQIDN